MFHNLPPIQSSQQPKAFVNNSRDQYITMYASNIIYSRLETALQYKVLQQQLHFHQLDIEMDMEGGPQINIEHKAWAIYQPFYGFLIVDNQIRHAFAFQENSHHPIIRQILYELLPKVLQSQVYTRICYHSIQKQEFIKDFIHTSILILLKKIIVCLELYYKQQYQEVLKLKNQFKYGEVHGLKFKQSGDILKYLFDNKLVGQFQPRYQNQLFNYQDQCLQFINENEFNSTKTPNFVQSYSQVHTDIKRVRKLQKFRINGKYFVRLLFYLQNIFSLDQIYNFQYWELLELSQYSQQQIPFHPINDHYCRKYDENKKNSDQHLITPTLQSLTLLLMYYQKCHKITSFYQDGFSNIWIVKSNHSSRGRNISLINNLKDIDNLDNGMKLIQKYIQNIWVLSQPQFQVIKQRWQQNENTNKHEKLVKHEENDQTTSQSYLQHDQEQQENPNKNEDKKWCKQKNKYLNMQKLVNKKFDIRLWVLVKSFNPLTVYIYEDGYLRISSQSYQLDMLGGNYRNCHLTNFSVNWNHRSKNKLKSHKYSCGSSQAFKFSNMSKDLNRQKQEGKSSNRQKESEQSYVLFSEFKAFLGQQLLIDTQKLTKEIETIIVQTLKIVQIKEDARCFELFGFDIILDAKLKPWILQCNMSPACCPRGQLRDLLKQMTSGMLTILGFLNLSMDNKKNTNSTTTKNGWKLLIDQSKKQPTRKSQSKIFKQLGNQNRTTLFRTTLSSLNLNTNLNMNRSSNININTSTLVNWNDSSISIKKLKWKSYRKLQNMHYFMEKIYYIQRVLKMKPIYQRSALKNRRNKLKYEKSNHKRPKIGQFLHIIQILSKVVKLNKKFHLSNFKKLQRRIKTQNKI